MLSSSPFLSVALATLLASSQVNALGCYHGGNKYSSLHGGDTDTHQEVVNDINSFCQSVAGRTLKTGKPGITHCSEWEITTSDHEDCYDNCIDGCSANPYNRELATIGCMAGCDLNCDPGPSGSRHIDWQINLDGPTKELTYDICNTAFNTELGGCSSGSEQNHDGFWFRIDPQDGGC